MPWIRVPPCGYFAWLRVLVGSLAPIRHAIILSAPEWRAMIFLLVRAWRIKVVIAMKHRQATRRAVQRQTRKSRCGKMPNGFFKNCLMHMLRYAGDLGDLTVDAADLISHQCRAAHRSAEKLR